VFLAWDLGLETKRLVYKSMIFGVLLYGVESWSPTQVTVQKLETFHRRCVRFIMEIGKPVQWAQHISSIRLAEYFGVRESISRLRWLGHIAQMPDDRIPKRFCLDGYLRQDLPMV